MESPSSTCPIGLSGFSASPTGSPSCGTASAWTRVARRRAHRTRGHHDDAGAGTGGPRGHKSAPSDATPALAVRDLRTRGGLGPLSFELHHGEVLGVAGLVGRAGRSSCARCSASARTAAERSSWTAGRWSCGTPARRLRAGLFMLPEDRKVEGIYPDLDVLDNLVVMRGSSGETALPSRLHRRRCRAPGVRTAARPVRDPSALVRPAHLHAQRGQPTEGRPRAGPRQQGAHPAPQRADARRGRGHQVGDPRAHPTPRARRVTRSWSARRTCRSLTASATAASS